MSILKGVYLNELFKLSRKKKLIAGIILFTLAVIAAGAIVFALNSFAGIRVTGSSEFSLLVLSMLNVTLIPLFTALVCIDLFSGEFSDDTMKLTLTLPASRLKVFLGKALAVATYLLGMLGLVMFLSMGVSLLINGFTFNPFKILLAYILAFFPLMVYALFVILLANLAKSAAGAFALSVMVFLVCYGFGFAFPNIQSFFFTASLQWHQLFLGSYVNLPKILRVFLILLGYHAMLFGLGFYIFEKKDL